MWEIRFHGRGGQGVVTAGQIVAAAAFREGKQAQSFAAFGMERRGAPVTAFARVDEIPIQTRGMVHHPDVLVLLDPSVMRFANTFAGLKPKGMVVVNSSRSLEEVKVQVNLPDVAVFPIDATRISVSVFGQTSIPFTNVVMVGAFTAAGQIVAIESVIAVLPQFFPAKALEQNKKAGLLGYQQMEDLHRRYSA
jgi:2-oxoacid:acceptor oxidoreductase gamma subunit (pyruvate/2-ketoisovalerate family)